MSVKWIDTSQLSFDSLLLLERIQISWLNGYAHERELAIALKVNPEVEWFLRHKCPEISPYLEKIASTVPSILEAGEIREAEQNILAQLNDWLTYVIDPAIYDKQAFLQWDSNELLSIIDFTDKIVLDIGAGTGRLAFVAASQAKVVYAVEPVGNLRFYLREKAGKLGIRNLYPVDGLITQIPFSDNFADVVISGHVFPDILAEQIAATDEIKRVIKTGGIVVHCPGNIDENNATHRFFLDRGYNWGRFEEPADGWRRKYWKTL
jgi:SAM-dependent methyltransferase